MRVTPPRQFVARAAEYMLQVGLEEQVAAFFGRGHYSALWRRGARAASLPVDTRGAVACL